MCLCFFSTIVIGHLPPRTYVPRIHKYNKMADVIGWLSKVVFENHLISLLCHGGGECVCWGEGESLQKCYILYS